MKQIIFLYNYMLADKWQEKSKLPLTFISFGYINAKLYRIEENYIAIDSTSKKHKWNDDKLYGAFYILDSSEYYLRILDGIMGCSLTSLNKNHIMDYMHRKKIEAIPIYFDTITEFAQLLYREKESIQCFAYFGNVQNKLINYKVNNSYRNREKYGFDKVNFINLLNKYKKI